MKKGNFIVKLVFGIMGVVYSIIGLVCLTIARNMAGDIRRIFRLPEDDLALAIVGVVFSVLGVGFLIATVCVILAGRRQKRLREELLAYGQRVQGEVVDVRINRSIQVNGRSPLVAQVKASFPRGDVTLKSRNLWNACPATGDKVDVLYDAMDESRYVIEFPGE
jgi:hypothetical protein